MSIAKKLLAFTLAILTVITLSACSMLNKKETTTKKKTYTTTARPTVSKDEEILKDGKFVINRSYTFNVNESTKVDGETYNVIASLRLALDTAGNATLTNLETNTKTEYTYNVEDKLITCTNKSSGSVDYYYYYGDVVVSADIFLYPGTLDGAAVSQNSKTTLAYVAYVVLNKDDVPAVLAKNSNNKNKYYKIYKNGEREKLTSGQYVIADQLATFDTSKTGKYITTLQVSKTAYPVVVVVQ